MQILERSDAVKLNVRRYFTGRPCRRGHLAERFTSSGQCVACMKKAVGMFVRFSVEAHQDDRVAVELFAHGLAAARGHVSTPFGLEEMSPDERYYRLVIVARWRKNGAKPEACVREYQSFKLPDGEMPW